jgi:hypothetical protein
MRARSRSRKRPTHCALDLTLASLLALAGCSKDSQPGKVKTPVGGSTSEPDAGDARDAGELADGGGRARDAAVSGDAAMRGDGARPDNDAGPDDTDPAQRCAVATELSELSQPASFADEAGFALTPGLTGFGVAFMRRSTCDSILTLPVSATGAYKQPNALLGDCSARVEDVGLLHQSDGYRLLWVDNSTGSSELQSLLLPETLGTPAELTRMRITNNTRRELRPVLASFGSQSYAAWISLDPESKSRELMLQPADGSDEARTLTSPVDGFTPMSLALAQLGKESGAVAFVSEQNKPGVWLLPLAPNGEPRSAPVRLSAAVTTGNAVDLATREEGGGAVIYSVDVGALHEVRFRRLGDEGEFLSDEIKVVSGALHGRDASLARLGGGYVVAFRSMPTGADAKAEVRLMFVTKEGNLQRDSAGRVVTYPVAEAGETGGRVSVRVSTDGQLLVGFLDASETGPKFRLIRKRLDCAL